ncbi:hypothetical protein ACS0TY_030829 [Phlomoides rotata]
MDGNCNSVIGGRGRKRVVPNSRRVWTYAEELELVSALKELVVRGQKCDNGFKSGYLLLLENMLVLNKRANNTRVNNDGGFEAGEAPDPTEFFNSGFASFNIGESSSATKDKGKGVKRKQLDGIALQFIDTIGN